MTEQPQQYQDGQIVNGWQYQASTNTWVRPTPVTAAQSFQQHFPNEFAAAQRKTPWGKIIGVGVAGFFGILILIGVLGAALNPTPTPVPAATQAAPQPVQPAPAEPVPNYQPEPEPDFPSDEEIDQTALEFSWSNLTPLQQQQICDGWNLGPAFQEEGLDSFVEGSGGTIDRERARQFFDEKCS